MMVLAFQASEVGSIPTARSNLGYLAQLVEPVAVNRLVGGSSPSIPAILMRRGAEAIRRGFISL